MTEPGPEGARRGPAGQFDARPGLTGWPVNLLVAGRRVVVVGGGRIAARKAQPLVELGAEVVVVAPELGADMRAIADAGRLVEVRARPFTPADLDGAWLAVSATDDAAVNHDVFVAAEARRVWCNSADDPANCSFTLMATVRQADLVVAIGTGGRSPALATWLKRHVGDQMGPEFATLLDLLSEAREEMRANGRSSEDADWQRAFSSGIVDLVRSGRVEDAKEVLRSCL